MFHWLKVSDGKRGTSFEKHVRQIKNLPKDRMLRVNQAGDLPKWKKHNTIDRGKAIKLLHAAASGGRISWVHTHYYDPHSTILFQNMNAGRWGFIKGPFAVVNLSANDPDHADSLSYLKLPLTCIVPEKKKVQYTPFGRRIVLCPAQSVKGVTCETCGNGNPLCARRDRDYIIGFYPHGSGKERMLIKVKNAGK